MEEINKKKAETLYKVIDNSNFFIVGMHKRITVEKHNTFRLPDENLEKEFISKATETGFAWA
jgi:phosphoserine aminotransferase